MHDPHNLLEKWIYIMDDIDRIETVRRNNNGLWMSILRIAVAQAPEETAKVLEQVLHNDRLVNEQLKCLLDRLRS